MPVNAATIEDVAARSLRALTAEEQAWVAVRLEDAFVQILAAVPAAASRLDTVEAGDPYPQLVVQVQSQMVLRVLANPDGILEETVDDFTRRLDAAVSSGALYLTAGEVDLLSGGSNGSGGAGAFSVRAVPYPVRLGGWW